MAVTRLTFCLVTMTMFAGFTLISPDGLMITVADKAPLSGGYVCFNEASRQTIEWSFGGKAGLTLLDNSVPETIEADMHRDIANLGQRARFLFLSNNLFALAA